MSDSKSSRRSSPPRPDQLPTDVVDFIKALDHYKRASMRSYLVPEDMFPVLESMGYAFDGEAVQLEQTFKEALDVLRAESGRPFPNWSELYDIALEIGWSR